MSTVQFDNTPADGFAFGRVRVESKDLIVVVVDQHAYPVASALGVDYSCVQDLFTDWERHLDEIQHWAQGVRAGGGEPPLAIEHRDMLPPVMPSNVFQAAANYRKHVIDLMVAAPRPEHQHYAEPERREFATQLMDERAASGTPTVFSGLPSSMSGPYDDVIIPHITEQCDWELELAAVIGTTARYVTRESAMSFVAGYTIVNDISMRDRLYPSGDSKRGADWLACKSAPTFLPTGPLLVPARFVPDPGGLTITLRLNGEIMQNESTSDMIFDLPRLLEHTSHCARMLPGDLLLTGSPAGNGVHHGRFLAAGDIMDGRITGLGVQRTPTVAEPEPALS